MKTKKISSLALLSLLVLAGCDSSTSSSAEPAESTYSADSTSQDVSPSEISSADSSEEISSSSYTLDNVTYEVACAALDAFANSEVQSYTYHYRRYQDNYLTGGIYTNTAQVLTLNVHEDGVEGTLVNSTPAKVTDLEGAAADNYGTVASYSYDENYFIYGYQSENDSSESFAQYVEKNPWNSAVSIFDYFTDNVAGIDLFFTDPNTDSTWSEDLGYIHDGFSVVEEDDAFVCTYSVHAAEEGYYGAEEGSVEVALSREDLSVLSCYYYSLVYDPGYSSDPDANANGYTVFGFSDVVFGDPLENGVEPLDLTKMSSIGGEPETYSTIELADGNLTEQNVIDIFSNIEAYEEGAIKTDYTAVSEVYDSQTLDTIGNADLKGSVSLYQDYILISEESIAMQDETLSAYNYTSVGQYTIGETGIDYAYQAKFTDGTIAGESAYTIDADYVSSLSDYFDASLTSIDYSLESAMFSLTSEGFGTTDYSYMKWTYSLAYAVKEGSTITIEIDYSAEYSWSDTPESMTYVITIVDDFLTSSVDTDQDGNVSTYTSTKGELPAYTGTLL